MRKATTDDIPGMIALQRAVEEDDAIWGYGSDPAEEWAKRDLTWSIVAFGDDDLRGFIYCEPRPYAGECVFAAGSKILEITELVIAECERNRGLGSQLVAAMRRQAEEDGFTHMKVYSAAKRFDDIVKFYRRCGFSPWYVEMTQPIGAEQDAPA
jgi:GNAT superfamily N-acetyltransferase